MEKKDIDRLNELREIFENDPDYKEYTELVSRALKEQNAVIVERSLMGIVDGAKYYLLLPYEKMSLQNGKWGYEKHGLDMEIRYPDGSFAVTCMSLCKKPAEYFINRMLEGAKKAEMDGEE